MACDMASVSPTRSDSSAKRAVPAWETRFLPSGITSGRRTDRLRCTCKEPSASGWECRCGDNILPVEEGFYADSWTVRSGPARIIKARDHLLGQRYAHVFPFCFVPERCDGNVD